MKRLLLLLLFLTACAAQTPVHCAPQQSGCAIGEEGNRNVDLFETRNPDLVSTQDVEYVEGYTGFLAQPKAEGSYSGVIMIHEWWGLNEHIKEMAGLLAQEGYVVLAVDLYGKVATTQEEARAYTTEVRGNQAKATENLRRAADYLRMHPYVNGQLASLGWCFGGGQSLQLALSGEDLDATVIYYGNLVNDTAQLSVINQPVLGIFGELDAGIPVSSVRAFESGLNQVGVENEIHIYPGVGHAFANPSGGRYAPNETVDAWQKTLEFLDENLD